MSLRDCCHVFVSVASQRIDESGQRQTAPRFPPPFKGLTTGAVGTTLIKSGGTSSTSQHTGGTAETRNTVR